MAPKEAPLTTQLLLSLVKHAGEQQAAVVKVQLLSALISSHIKSRGQTNGTFAIKIKLLKSRHTKQAMIT